MENKLGSPEKPLVSILMTVYNRERYIREAIESVLISTYTNWELLIVDDKSKDCSVSIAQSYSKKDSRIKVYTNDKNLGDYPNRNKAASYAKGKYLKYLDADDIIYPHCLDVMVSCMEKFPKAGWGITSLPNDKNKAFPFLLSPAEIYRRDYLEGLRVLHRSPLSVIIKRKIFEKMGGFSPVKYYGDYQMWHRMAISNDVVLMPSGLVWWRSHEEQESKYEKGDIYLPFKTVDAAMVSIKDPQFPLSALERKIILNKTSNFKKGYLLKLLLKGKVSAFLKLSIYLFKK